MSIAFESTTSSRIERPGLHHGMQHGTVYDSPDSGRTVFGNFPGGDRRLSTKNLVEDRLGGGEEDSTSSSSIGVNSDTSGGTESDEGQRDSDEVEVQSSFKGSLDTLEALEEVLPIKRSMSKFYNGKSKSFTSLAEAAYCRSIKDIVKPEDAYTRKRKNLLAHSIFWDKNPQKPSRASDIEGGLFKKPASNTSRSNMGMAIREIISSDSNQQEHSSASPVRSRPPLHPQSRKSSPPPPVLPNREEEVSPFPLPTTTTSPRSFSSWRSFSLSDLQCASGPVEE
ncbi:uncharacterized protein LOC124914573 [Impatiens glandulifera]|uniref:uncharacterized protein LOC124914573 n=1 Tax=Impatiens glandulifera TaxID=253017 RepID=UPI001FB057E4|nr:uncharacterized protein LOC124914573 [Impatiens glandulifera]